MEFVKLLIQIENVVVDANQDSLVLTDIVEKEILMIVSDIMMLLEQFVQIVWMEDIKMERIV